MDLLAEHRALPAIACEQAKQAKDCYVERMEKLRRKEVFQESFLAEAPGCLSEETKFENRLHPPRRNGRPEKTPCIPKRAQAPENDERIQKIHSYQTSNHFHVVLLHFAGIANALVPELLPTHRRGCWDECVG